LGTKTDKKIIRAGKLKFISRGALQTAENWFIKYGYSIILFNRFVSGVRSVISFFAGMSELPVKRTVILSLCSALLYHLVIISLGYFFGSNIHRVDYILSVYGNIVLLILASIVVFIVGRMYIKKMTGGNSTKK